MIYAHGVINVYIVALDGGKPPVGESLISVAMTWILGMIVGFLWLAKRKTARSN